MATAKAKLKIKPFTNEPFIDFSNPSNKKKMELALAKVKSEFGREYPMWIGGGKKVITPGKAEVHQPIAAFGSDWRVPRCDQGTGHRSH